MATNSKVLRRTKIKSRVRGKIFGTPDTPRLAVFRSNKQIYAQIIDDVNGVTLAAAGSVKIKEAQSVNKVDQAGMVGKAIAEVAKGKDIENVVFDRSGYLYHGRIKSLADAAREAGLKF